MNGQRRTFLVLRKLILLSLLDGQQTTNQISVRTGVNWRTADAHLTFLIGKGFVTEVLKSEYVRIFKLTPIGEEHAKFLGQADGDSALPQQQKREEYGKKTRMEVTQL